LESGSAPASGAANGALAVGIPARGTPLDSCPRGAEFCAGRAEQQPGRLRSPSLLTESFPAFLPGPMNCLKVSLR